MKLIVFLITSSNTLNTNELPYIDRHYEFAHIYRENIATFSDLSILIRKYKPVTFCTIGDRNDFPTMNLLPYEYRKKWLHFNTIQECTSNAIENCYIHSIIANRFSRAEPLFSVITTTFHSGDKLLRPYNSLKSQTYTNWEWVLWDDSKEDYTETWEQLKKYQEDDIRIQCFRATNHSGYIGEMKWRSASLSRGEWIVELDHDDIIHEKLFEWCNNAIKQYPDADFICSSCIELHEGNEEPFSYGDFYAFGYGSYQKEWLRGKWHNVSPIPHINPMTIRHIVGVPNHIRIWRRSFYENIGKHNPDLPVVDDYELLLRSFIQGKWIHIHAPGYFQFRNNGGNNFTFLRNSLIQYLTKKIQILYDNIIHESFISKEIEDTCYNNWPILKKAWEKIYGFQYDKLYYTYVPDINTEKTVSIVCIIDEEICEEILNTINSIIGQQNNEWILYLIGNNSINIENTMKIISETYDESILKKIKWWNLSQKNTKQIALNYVHRMLLVTELVTYINIGDIWEKDYLDILLNNIYNKSNSKIWSEDNTLHKTIHKYELLKNVNEFSEKSIAEFV